jgi:hypothetical protein
MAPNQTAVDAALQYLAARGALHKLSTPVPVIGRSVLFCVTAWQTPPEQPVQHDVLPPLEKGARI